MRAFRSRSLGSWALVLGVALGVGKAWADDAKVIVIPFTTHEGAPERAGSAFAGKVADELKSREGISLLPLPKGTAPARSSAGEAALADGKKAAADLRFDEAAGLLKKGIDQALAEPAGADFEAVYEALVALGVAAFRTGDEKGAQSALLTVARLNPDFKLGAGYPPIFVREFEKAKRRVEKLAKGNVAIEGPPGSTAFLNGRDLGMVPVVEEQVPVGTQYVKVEGPRGERFGQVVELKGGTAKVRGSFPAGAGPAAPQVGRELQPEDFGAIVQFGRAAGADFVVVGTVYRVTDYQLALGSALVATRQQAVAGLPTMQFAHDLQTANTEAFKVADAVAQRVTKFGTPSSLPLVLVTKARAASVAIADPKGERDVEVKTPTRPVLRPDPKPSAKEGLVFTDPVPPPTPPPPGPATSGSKVWVWVVAGVGVAAAAAGGYYGYTQMTRPVTGTVTAQWE